MSDAPRTDEWYVTDTDTPEVFDKIRNETICGIYGGKTIGEQYDIAARIAKLPDLERELTAMTKQRDRLAETIDRLDVAGIHSCHSECARANCVLRRKIAAVSEQRDRLAVVLQRIRDGYGGQIASPNCCEDCDYLLPIDKALQSLNPKEL